MTTQDVLAVAFDRAQGVCECIGGGCPSLTHRPDVNRCFGKLPTRDTTFFFTVARFADRSDPENIVAICASCAESPRKNMQRVFAPAAPVGSVGEAAEEGAP